MDCVFFLVHVVDDVRTCREQMVFYVINNRVKPFTVMLEDGTLIDFTLPDGNIREGGIQPSDDGVRCTLENLESVEVWGESLLTNERVRFDTFMDNLATGGGSLEEGSGAVDGVVSAWEESVNGQPVIILSYDITTFRLYIFRGIP